MTSLIGSRAIKELGIPFAEGSPEDAFTPPVIDASDVRRTKYAAVLRDAAVSAPHALFFPPTQEFAESFVVGSIEIDEPDEGMFEGCIGLLV